MRQARHVVPLGRRRGKLAATIEKSMQDALPASGQAGAKKKRGAGSGGGRNFRERYEVLLANPCAAEVKACLRVMRK